MNLLQMRLIKQVNGKSIVLSVTSMENSKALKFHTSSMQH